MSCDRFVMSCDRFVMSGDRLIIKQSENENLAQKGLSK